MSISSQIIKDKYERRSMKLVSILCTNQSYKSTMATKRQQQSIETRNRIVEAVSELVATTEVDKIKIRDICKNAGVSLGSFYVYFSCKEEAILYIYRNLDRAFEDLKLQGNPKENILLILRTYYEMANLNNLNFARHIYSCHLTYYDEYFFDEKRPIFKALNQELIHLNNLSNTHEITWKILDFMRGRIFNLCIRFKLENPNWFEEQVALTWQYIQFLIQSSNN